MDLHFHTIILYYYFTPFKNVDNIDTFCEYIQIYKKNIVHV